MKRRYGYGLAVSFAALTVLGMGAATASSHREAPAITRTPKVDGTDLYFFRSFAPGRQDFATVISNYQPGENPGDGPNYYTMDPDAIYEIHFDQNGDAVEDLTFQFDFNNILRNDTGLTVNVGGKTLPVPLRHLGQLTTIDDADLGEVEEYTVTMITGPRRTGQRAAVTNAAGGGTTFRKPFDHAGEKSIPDYNAYANQFIYNVNIPGCATQGRVFVGQRAESFAVNLGPLFDLVNFVPIEGDSAPGAGDGRGFRGGITQSDINQQLVGKHNVTSIAMEIPIACLRGSGNGVVGSWMSASLPQARLLRPTPSFRTPGRLSGPFVQVSRLGHPLVNEVVIGVPQKDLFNASAPAGDAALIDYITNPTFPAILDSLFRAPVNATLGTNLATLAPTNFPRQDLVATFLTGIRTLNQQAIVTPSELLRLNLSVPATAQAAQSPFGVVGDDLAGYPNGRRPGDDVVDIVTRVAMGRLCHPVPISGVQTSLGLCNPSDAPTGTVPYTDGAPSDARSRLGSFPYMNPPLRGAPRPLRTNAG